MTDQQIIPLDITGSKVSGGEFILERDVMIPTRDQTLLAADVFRPNKDGQFPVLITMSPYQKDIRWHVPEGHTAARHEYQCWETADPLQWVSFDYVMIRVDSRGAGKSSGTHDVFAQQESHDYYDAIEWAASQPWSNGNIGATGISYYAMSQWRVAALNPPSFKAFVPWGGGADMYRDTAYPGGMMRLDFLANWYGRLITDHHHTDSRIHNANYGSENGLYHWARHALDSDYWRGRSADLEAINVPFISGMGWIDLGAGHLRGNMEGFKLAKTKDKKLLMPPGSYFMTYYSDPVVDIQKRFFDHWLTGDENGTMNEPPVRYAARRKVMDPKGFEWREENEWPIARTDYVPYYFGQTGDDLTLSREPPKAEESVTYDAPGELPLGVNPMNLPEDLKTAGLSFVSAPFDEEVEITGEFKLALWAASSYDDMDLHVFVHNIHPDGAAEEIAKGWLKASLRKLDPEKSAESRPYYTFDEFQKLTPGEPTYMEVEIMPSGNIFQEGSRLKVQVSGKAPGFLSDWHRRPRGQHTLYFGGDHASYLLAPIVPKK